MTLEITGNRADHIEKRISELEVINLQITQVEEERKLSFLQVKNSIRAIQVH